MAFDFNGNLVERTRQVFHHREYNLFLFTGVTGDNAKPSVPIDISNKEKSLSVPNYSIKPNFEVSLAQDDYHRAYVLAVPYNAMSRAEKLACSKVAKEFNKKSSIELQFDRANNVLRIRDMLTDKGTCIYPKHLDAEVRHKLNPKVALIF